MLSKNTVVKTQKAIERSYRGCCDVVERQAVEGADMSTGFEEVTIYTAQPCKLSFESTPATQRGDGVNAVSQSVKVFLSPSLMVAAGSKLVVTQDGVTTAYWCSSAPVRHPTHQELSLELFRGWT